MLEKLELILAEDAFEYVILLAGTNDLGIGFDSEVIINNLKKNVWPLQRSARQARTDPFFA